MLLLKLLRNFGHLIRNLGISFRTLNDKLCIEIENYLVKYCSNSLQRLILVSKSKLLFENLQKPFKNITALEIILVIDQNEDNIRFINESNFPNLQRIYLLNTERKLQDSEMIHYKNIEYFCLRSSLRTMKFPFSFGNLKHFSISGPIELNDAFCKCIGNIEHLQTLKIISFLGIRCHSTTDSFGKIFELKNILTNVVEMQMEFHENITPELVHRLLKQSEKLRKLSFHVHHYPELSATKHFFYFTQTLPSNLDDKWKCYTIDPYHSPCLYVTEHAIYSCFVIERIIH